MINALVLVFDLVLLTFPGYFGHFYLKEGYAKTPAGGAENAERLLRQMMSLPSHTDSKRSAAISPSLISFQIVMDGWCRSGTDDAVERVEAIMDLAKKNGIQPSVFMYTTLITTYARSLGKDAPAKAEAILEEMKANYESGDNLNCKPTAATFAAVMKCIGDSSNELDAPERVESILNHMKAMSQRKDGHDLEVNFSALKHALWSWVNCAERRTDAGDRAVKLLDLVDECYMSEKMAQNLAITCYQTALVVLTRVNDPHKSTKAEEVLKRMKQKLGATARASDYSKVIKACSLTALVPNVTEDRTKEAVDIASRIYEEYLKSGTGSTPDDITIYLRMINLYRRTSKTQEEIDTLVTSFLADVPESVKVSESICASLKTTVSPQLYKQLVEK